MKYVKPKKVYEQEIRDHEFLTENLNEGRFIPTRGNYKIEWPLSEDKYAEWTPKEISDVEKLEYDDGEWGGFAISRNWTDKNPIKNFNQDFLEMDPGNLFYNKTKIGSMTITSYNVTSGDHVVAKMEVRILKVNNGKKDGYVCFYEFGIDSEYNESEDAIVMLDSWSRVIKMLKSLRDKMKSGDGFDKVLHSPAKKSVRFLLNESINEGKYFTLNTGAGQFLTGADNGETTTDPKDALKFDDIKSATKAAKEFDRKGFPNMVHVMKESVNESLALSIAGGIVLGVVGAIAAVKGLKGVSNIGANILDAAALSIRDAKDMAEDKKLFKEVIVPIAKRFENDKELEKMYQELNPFMAGYSKAATAKNKERTKGLNKIAKYIKSKLTKDELFYFSEVSAVLRTGEAKVGRNRFSTNEGRNDGLQSDIVNIDQILMNTKNRNAKRDWEEYTEDLFLDYSGDQEMWRIVDWEDIEDKDIKAAIDTGHDIMRRYGIKESVNEAKVISKSKIDMMGSRILGKIKLGTILVTDGGDYTITGFGPKSNAFQEYEAEKNDTKEPCKVKLTAMYGVKLEVTDDPRSAVYRKEEQLNSVIFESINEGDRTSKINTLDKFIKASKLRRGTSMKDLLQFIYDNFEDITGEKYQGPYDFISNDFIADIVSFYKYGEEVIDAWKSMFESVNEGMSKNAIKKSIKVIDKQIYTETGGDGEPLDNETLQALEKERERLESMLEGKSINEGRKRIRVKRKYGEKHPEKSVGKYGPVREAILRHVKENGGTVSKNSLKEFINGMNEDKGTKTSWSWVRRNAKYIKETRFGYKLTKLGERVLKATSLNESIILNEGQFSWMTQDTGNQIGSQRENTIFVTMFDDKGNRYEEKGYDGYGEFGGKDYYELLAEMNGINKDNVDELIDKCKVRVFGKDLTGKLRQCGIELAFESNKKLTVEAAKITGTTKLKYPALYEYPNKFNKNRHDFNREAESDPNQSWYMEDDSYDEDGYF